MGPMKYPLDQWLLDSATCPLLPYRVFEPQLFAGHYMSIFYPNQATGFATPFRYTIYDRYSHI